MTLSLPSAAQVRAVITTSKTDEEIDAIVVQAEALVSSCSGVSNASAAMQETILSWVTAHLIASPAGGGGIVQSEALGDASKSYAVSASPNGTRGLHSTRYGQQAIMFDITGCLAQLGGRRVLWKTL